MSTVARRGLLVVFAGVLALLASCSSLGAANDLGDKIEAEGFSDTEVSLNTSSSDGDVVDITVGGHESLSGDQARQAVARVVWTEFPMRFDKVQVEIDGEARHTTYDTLQSQLGPRPSGLDDKDLGDEVGSDIITVLLIVGGVLMLVTALVVVLTVILVRRNKRKKQQQGPWGPYGPHGTYPGGYYPSQSGAPYPGPDGQPPGTPPYGPPPPQGPPPPPSSGVPPHGQPPGGRYGPQ